MSDPLKVADEAVNVACCQCFDDPVAHGPPIRVAETRLAPPVLELLNCQKVSS
jgi:hypothetical protein